MLVLILLNLRLGAVQAGLSVKDPNVMHSTLYALALCSNIHSLTWIDDCTSPNNILGVLLSVVRHLPLQELTIRTHNHIDEASWTQLSLFTSLRKLSLWSMSGPSRILEGFCNLGKALTQLELGLTCFSLDTCLHCTCFNFYSQVRDVTQPWQS
jgi:hypothetical protein